MSPQTARNQCAIGEEQHTLLALLCTMDHRYLPVGTILDRLPEQRRIALDYLGKVVRFSRTHLLANLLRAGPHRMLHQFLLPRRASAHGPLSVGTRVPG